MMSAPMMLRILEKLSQSIDAIRTALLFGSVVFSVALIALHNGGILPLGLGDFVFFSFLVLLFALYRPEWALLFFIGSLPFEVVNVVPVEIGIMLRPYQWIGVLTLVAVTILFFSGRLPFSFPKIRRLDWLLVVFWLGSLVALAGAPDRGVSLKQSLVLFSFIALYALVRIFVRTIDDLKIGVAFFLGSGIVVALYAIWQNIRFASGLDAFEVMPGRSNSVFAEPDWLGAYIMVMIYLVYVLLYRHHAGKTEFRVPKYVGLYSALSLFFVTLILTVARSAWLGVAAATGVFFVFVLTQGSMRMSEWKWRSVAFQAAGILFAGAVGFGAVMLFHLTTFQLSNRAQSVASGLQKITVACGTDVALPEKIGMIDELAAYGCRHIMLEEKDAVRIGGETVKEIYRNDPNVDIRKRIYMKTWNVLDEHFLTGVGWGSSGLFLGRDERGAGLNASNMFLEVWLGSGLIGLIAFVVLWFSIGGMSFKRLLATRQEDAVRITTHLFIMLSWIGLTIFNLFNSGVLLGFFWVWLAIATHFSRK